MIIDIKLSLLSLSLFTIDISRNDRAKIKISNIRLVLIRSKNRFYIFIKKYISLINDYSIGIYWDVFEVRRSFKNLINYIFAVLFLNLMIFFYFRY